MNDLLIQFNALMEDLRYTVMASPAPVIKSGASPLAKTGATTTFLKVGGVYASIAASTDLDPTGINIGAGKYKLIIFATDGTTITAFGGVEGATAAAATFPTITAGLTAFAGLLVTYASAFTGGTTPLDTATTVYFPVVGPWHGAFAAAKVGNLAGTAITA
jgi:hypothetical protein